ncbi:MAG: type II toxin-antitoxin system VapC family toxin [Aestuariivirga sp.]
MTSTLIDTNVLVDVIEDRPAWSDWAAHHLAELSKSGSLVINQIIYAEASVPYVDPAAFERIVSTVWMEREDLPWAAAFRAGKAFQDYRQRGGLRNQSLPDFLIGAHAAVKNYRLLTRDATRFRTYFPEIEIIAPDTHP